MMQQHNNTGKKENPLKEVEDKHMSPVLGGKALLSSLLEQNQGRFSLSGCLSQWSG